MVGANSDHQLARNALYLLTYFVQGSVVGALASHGGVTVQPSLSADKHYAFGSYRSSILFQHAQDRKG